MTATQDGLSALRAAFPVLREVAFLNAGTHGPVPAAATLAARAQLEHERDDGRGSMAFFEPLIALRNALRPAYAARLGARPEDVALTTSTTDGVIRVLSALELGPGDEVLTTTDEHPGVYAPLIGLRARGVEVREVPFADVADAVGPKTRIVVVSHVNWKDGRIAPAALSELDVPVLLDGAQAVGAIPIDVGALGCVAYAGPGQKWLCGPDSMGMLYVSPAFRDRLRPVALGFINLTDPNANMASEIAPDASAFDAPAVNGTAYAYARASLEVLDAAGWEAIFAHAHGLAARAADELRTRGREVLPRDRSTLVSWYEPDANAVFAKLAEAGVIVRPLPDGTTVRASFGGWSSEDDLDRLLTALA